MSSLDGVLFISNSSFRPRNHDLARRLAGARIFSDSNERESQDVCKALKSGDVRAVVLLGGDGTVNSVLPYLKGKQIPLLVLPGGTANDLSRETGIHGDWEMRIERILNCGQSSEADVVQVSGGRCFVTVGGYGIGARVTGAYNRLRARYSIARALARILGSNAYKILSVAWILFGQDLNHEIEVEADGFRRTLRSAAGFVANQARLGGGIQVASGAKNDDGRFEVTLLPEKSRIGLVWTLLRLSLGWDCPELIRFSTRKLKIRDLDGRDLANFGDGEPFSPASEIAYEVSADRILLLRDSGLEQPQIAE
jgi:diacylglycerol kinase (ATP)